MSFSWLAIELNISSPELLMWTIMVLLFGIIIGIKFPIPWLSAHSYVPVTKKKKNHLIHHRKTTTKSISTKHVAPKTTIIKTSSPMLLQNMEKIPPQKIGKHKNLRSLTPRSLFRSQRMLATDISGLLNRPSQENMKKFQSEIIHMKDVSGKQGYLKKRATNFIAGWQRRYFRTKGIFLCYYKDKNSDSILKAINLQQAQLGSNNFQNKSDSSKRENEAKMFEIIKKISEAYTFEILISGHCIELAAETEEDAKEWLDVLRKRIEKCSAGISTLEEPTIEEKLEKKKPVSFDQRVHCSEEERKLMAELKAVVSRCEDNTFKVLRNKFPEVISHIISSFIGEKSSIEPTEDMLLRFLRARDLDVKAAESFLISHLLWRENTFPIPPEEVRNELSKGKYMLMGLDKKSNPIILINEELLGQHTYDDFDSMLKGIVFAIDQICEKLLPPAGRFTVVFSRVSSSSKNLDIKWTMAVAELLQNNYPERLEKGLAVPTNFAFRTFWSMVKHFFDPATASKAVFLDDVSNLTEYIEPENLISALGGTFQMEFDVEKILYPERFPELQELIRTIRQGSVDCQP